MQKNKKLIWFDFGNAPHVPVLLPIVEEMRNRGYRDVLTARDKAETKELLSMRGEKHRLIGKSFPKNKFLKTYLTIERALMLIIYLKRKENEKIYLSVSHGSRSAILASWFMRIPSIVLFDYEYTSSFVGNIFATRVLMPKLVNEDKLKETSIQTKKVDFYPGIKEQIYISPTYKTKDVLEHLKIDKSRIIILLRPPSITAHYHNPESEIIMREIFNKMSRCHKEKIFLITLPRSKKQSEEISNFIKCKSIPYLIPKKHFNGLDLILNSDLVLGGGGTMTREAAVLGVPSYTFFKGPKGAVDEFLEKNNRLIFIRSISDIEKIHFEKKQENMNILKGDREKIISSICDRLESLIT